MIISHCCGGKINNFIASFLLPLFMVLTGYTLKSVSSVAEIKSRIWKDIKRLIVPAMITLLLRGILDVLINGISVAETLKIQTKEFWWAFPFHTGWLPVWFLILLFWTKIIYYLVDYYFGKESYAIYFLLSFLGAYIGTTNYHPQALDIAMVMVIFLYFGSLLREKKNFLTNINCLSQLFFYILGYIAS